jgi:hypothetical protein
VVTADGTNEWIAGLNRDTPTAPTAPPTPVLHRTAASQRRRHRDPTATLRLRQGTPGSAGKKKKEKKSKKAD